MELYSIFCSDEKSIIGPNPKVFELKIITAPFYIYILRAPTSLENVRSIEKKRSKNPHSKQNPEEPAPVPDPLDSTTRGNDNAQGKPGPAISNNGYCACARVLTVVMRRVIGPRRVRASDISS